MLLKSELSVAPLESKIKRIFQKDVESRKFVCMQTYFRAKKEGYFRDYSATIETIVCQM